MQDGNTSSLRRALTLLDTFTVGHAEMSMRELARRSGIARSTTHRLVQELVEWGGLERGPGGLRLGVKLFELGTMAPTQSTLRDAASPFLHTLNEVTRLTANLGIREGGNIVYLDKISTSTLNVPHSRLGGRGILHATGIGKAILAFSPKNELIELFEKPLEAVTPKTITDEATLRTELTRVHRERLAYDVEESCLGLFCVAAPILDRHGLVLGAVSVTGATALSQAERFGPVVAATARSIKRRLTASPVHRHPARPQAAK